MFYLFLYRSTLYHSVQEKGILFLVKDCLIKLRFNTRISTFFIQGFLRKIILLLILNVLLFKSPVKLLIKAFLLSLSVKNIYIPLLVWQTTELPSFVPTLFTQVISTLFLSYELDVLSLKQHAKLQILLFAAFVQVVPYIFL